MCGAVVCAYCVKMKLQIATLQLNFLDLPRVRGLDRDIYGANQCVWMFPRFGVLQMYSVPLRHATYI